jgi:adenylate cyclase
MKLTRRDRHDWRVFLWLSVTSAIISAYFGYAVAPPDTPMLRAFFSGVVNSLLIATPIFLFEIKSRRPGPLRRLRRLPLTYYFGLKVLFYVTVIVGGLILARVTVGTQDFHFDEMFRNSIVFAVAMAVFGNLMFEMGGLLGYGTLKNLLTGRYVQPKREQRTFLLIDMKDSTGIAERLGPVRFHELLNEFFRDVADAALECEAEIHKYVGDEAILTWMDEATLKGGDCLVCPFIAQGLIAKRSRGYIERFGVVPTFRAALHYGEIVAGEIGDVRREIAYVGDTLNVAARLLEAAKATGHDVLVSADLIGTATLPTDLRATPLPTLAVRGRAQPLEIFALARVGQD